MSSRITRRLIIYFLIIILLFTLISGLLFINLGRRGIYDAAVGHAHERGDRIATFIANILEAGDEDTNVPSRQSENPSDTSGGQDQGTGQGHRPASGQGQGQNTNQGQGQNANQGQGQNANQGQGQNANQGQGQNANQGQGQNATRNPGHAQRRTPSRNYIKWMNDLLETDIRLVSEDKAIVSAIDRQVVDFKHLSDSEKDLVERAFAGKITTASKDGDEAIIIVAAPIEVEGEVVSVALFEEANALQAEFLTSSLSVFLIAMLIGSILVAILATFFAKRFIKPLEKLSLTTKELREGNYQVATQVDQRDEIGDLAKNIDLLADRLAEARAQTQANEQMRDDLISNMSHELKTPVTVVKSSLEALKDGVVADPAQVEDYHQVLYEEMEFMEKLISDLMELNILRNKRLSLDKEDLNLIDVLGDAIRSQSLYAREAGVTIDRHFADSYLPFHGDYSKLRQLFIIIINNGIKYGQEEGRVDVVQEVEEGTWKVFVRNFGSPIASDDIDQLFQPFYRDKNTKKKGYGLGLAIAKEIADNHNISILVESDSKQTSFILAFPDA